MRIISGNHIISLKGIEKLMAVGIKLITLFLVLPNHIDLI